MGQFSYLRKPTSTLFDQRYNSSSCVGARQKQKGGVTGEELTLIGDVFI